MRIYKFVTTEQKDVIILEDVLVDNYKIRMMVDTGASKTIIDYNSLEIYPEYDGMLGLDFFQNNKICIDFVKSEITIS